MLALTNLQNYQSSYSLEQTNIAFNDINLQAPFALECDGW